MLAPELIFEINLAKKKLGIEESSPERWTSFPVTFGDFVRLYEAGA